MKKYIVDLSGRLVRNTPRRFSPLFRGGPHIPHLSDRRKEIPMNLFEKICWSILAAGAVFFALDYVWRLVSRFFR